MESTSTRWKLVTLSTHSSSALTVTGFVRPLQAASRVSSELEKKGKAICANPFPSSLQSLTWRASLLLTNSSLNLLELERTLLTPNAFHWLGPPMEAHSLLVTVTTRSESLLSVRLYTLVAKNDIFMPPLNWSYSRRVDREKGKNLS